VIRSLQPSRTARGRTQAGAPPAGAVLVTFTLADPNLAGQKLAVVGDFNGWDPHLAPMDLLDGTYTTTLSLPPGRYRFRYLAEDGQWFNDEAAHDYEANAHGGQDGVLEVSAAPAPARSKSPAPGRSKQSVVA
jgi:1,4-alpha-glucan branching enzyme